MPAVGKFGLTESQSKALAFIERYHLEHGYSPSMADIAKGIGGTSRGAIHRLLVALEERGRIRRLHNRARAIEVIYGSDSGTT